MKQNIKEHLKRLTALTMLYTSISNAQSFNLENCLFAITNTKTEIELNGITSSTIKNINDFSNERIVNIIAQQGTSIGSGVFLGKFKEKYLFATNYHVIRNSNSVQVSFNFTPSFSIESEKIKCSSFHDICVVSASPKVIETYDFFTPIVKLKNLKMIPSSDLSTENKIVYVGNIAFKSFYSFGKITAKFNDPDYFKDDSMIMMSTSALFNIGMSGGATIDENGNLIGLISFLNAVQMNKKNKEISLASFFLPTEWIIKVISSFDDKNESDTKSPFWEKNIPSFLQNLIPTE